MLAAAGAPLQGLDQARGGRSPSSPRMDDRLRRDKNTS